MRHPHDFKKIVITIEARMTSSRLPGKVLLPVNDQPLLFHLVRRLKLVSSVNAIVLATTTNRSDDVLASFAEEQGIGCFRGSEDDVMGRVLGAADSVGADVIVETLGDCIINDPRIIEQNIRLFLCNECDYVANGHIPSYPGGMGSQVFSAEILRQSSEMTEDPEEREHVTLHIRRHPELFRHLYNLAPPHLHMPELDLSVDERSDYELVKRILEHFGEKNPGFDCYEILTLLKCNPTWLEINRDVERRFTKYYGNDVPAFPNWPNEPEVMEVGL